MYAYYAGHLFAMQTAGQAASQLQAVCIMRERERERGRGREREREGEGEANYRKCSVAIQRMLLRVLVQLCTPYIRLTL